MARRRWLRLARLASGVVLVPVLVLAVAAALLLHLDLPGVRRVVARELESFLSRTFAGDVRIEQIGHLTPSSARGVRGEVRDPDGALVLRVDDLGIRIDLVHLFQSIRSEGAIAVQLPLVAVEEAEVDLDSDHAGQLRLARAFAPRSTTPSTPGRSVVVEASAIRFGRVRVHGRPPGMPLIDADVLDLRAAAGTGGARTHVAVERVGLVARELPYRLAPAGTLRGRFETSSTPGRRPTLDASFSGTIAGAPASLDAHLDNGAFDARLDVEDDHAERSLRFGPGDDAPLTLHAEASGSLPLVDAHARITLGGASATVDARVGFAADPTIDGAIHLRGIDLSTLHRGAPSSRLGGYIAARIRMAPDGIHARASGHLAAGRLADAAVPPVDFNGSLAGRRGRLEANIGGDVIPSELTVDVEPRGAGQRADVTLRSRIGELRRVPWIGSRASGSASVDASVRLRLPDMTPERADIRIDGRDIDAPSIHARRLIATARGNVAPFAVSVRGEGVKVGPIELATLALDTSGISVDAGALRVDRAALCATADAGILRAEVDRARFVPALASWRRSVGRFSFWTQLDLGKAVAMIPVGHLPLADLRGVITARGSLERRGSHEPSSLALHASTRGLAFAGPVGQTRHEGGLDIVGPPSWRSPDVDLGLDVRADSASGLTDVALRAWDHHGALVFLDAKALVPFDAIARTPRSLIGHLLDAPLSAAVVVPSRRLEDFPTALGVRRVPGVVQARLELTGTVNDPRARLAAEGRSVGVPTALGRLASNLALSGTYDGRAADAELTADAGGARVLAATAHVEANLRDFVGSRGKRDWQAQSDVRFSQLPLDALPFLAGERIRGRASGELHLTGLHRQASARANVALEDLAVGAVAFPSGTLTVDASASTARAALRLAQTDGRLDFSSSAGIVWGERLVPALDPAQTLDAKLVAVGFRAAALAPLVDAALPELDGRIDADITARIPPRSSRVELVGTARVHEGRAHVAALGADLGGIRADAKLSPDGSVRIDNVFARSGSGELRANIEAKLDGLRIAEAMAHVRVPERRPLDVTVEGIPLGEISGNVDAKLTRSRDGKETTLDVDVPRLAITLPRQAKTGVQALGRREDIRVGVHQSDRRFVLVPLYRGDHGANEAEASAEATRLTVNVNLRGVALARGNDLRAFVTGGPRIVLTNGEKRVFGQLVVQRGWLDVQGKRFAIDKGTITFDGQEPPDPTILATASWTAADGTRVFADFLGAVSTGRVTLRSEPARTKSEILALVLFGTADGANPTSRPLGPQPSAAERAALGLGGAVAARGLTEAIDSLTGVQAIARIDTTRANNPRPEIEFELSPRLTVGFAHVLGTPPITEPDKNLASFEYRFYKNWSVETVFGDRGTVLADTLWQKRY